MMWWLLLGMSIQQPACTPVSADQIIAADLARVIPEFAAAPPEAAVGYAPLPGTRRVFQAGELRLLAGRFHIQLAGDREACFEWPLEPVPLEAVIQSMRDVLQMPAAEIEIIDLSRRQVPQGRLVFPMKALIPPAGRQSTTALWRGYIQYAPGRRFDLLATVKILAPTARVIAPSDIPAGHEIAAGEVRLETVDDFPVWKEVARNLDDVVGSMAQRRIEAGRAILRTEVSLPIAVQAGQVITVEEIGRAHV